MSPAVKEVLVHKEHVKVGTVPHTNTLYSEENVRLNGIWDPSLLVRSGRCCFCSSERTGEIVRRADGLVINECSDCKLAFLDPRPSADQLAEYYGEEYFKGARDFFHGTDYCVERDNAIHSGTVTGYREIIANLNLTGKAVLDVGCASGALLYLLRQHQPKELIGIDSAEYPISFGIEHYGLDLRCRALENALLRDAQFDLVTLIDVIEHVEDLNTFLAELMRVLKPGGYVFVITPNYAAYSFAGDKWTCLFKDFEHLQYFDAGSLAEICFRSGLTLDKAWTDSQPTRNVEYPRLRKHGLHRLLHPQVAARNSVAAFRYRRATARRPLIGANLNAILRARD